MGPVGAKELSDASLALRARSGDEWANSVELNIPAGEDLSELGGLWLEMTDDGRRLGVTKRRWKGFQ